MQETMRRLIQVGQLADSLGRVSTDSQITLGAFAGRDSEDFRIYMLQKVAMDMQKALSDVSYLLESIVTTPFDRLTVEAIRHGMPINYSADLWKHDKEKLDETPPTTPFVWFLYPSGTHLFICDEGTTAAQAEEAVRTWAKYSSRYLIYVWDGESLSSCSTDVSFLVHHQISALYHRRKSDAEKDSSCGV